MIKIPVKASSKTSEILMDISLADLPAFCPSEKTIVITDATVKKLHGLNLPFPTIVTKPGEENKTLETVKILYDEFVKHEVDRSSFIVGFGGGLVCDIAGFAASTFMRGVSFGFAPTTLLSQVDASVGGKNGVNFCGYKNLVGTFNQPSFVLCDTETLKTLPERDFKSGFAEVIKHAAIMDPKYFETLESNACSLLDQDRDSMIAVIRRSIEIKAQVVEEDETEKGRRRILNFGHTIGHAIEKTTELTHGESVAVGMNLAARVSQAQGILSSQNAQRLESLIKVFGLPTEIKFNTEEIIDAIGKDKKRAGSFINMILLKDIGETVVREIEVSAIEGIVHDLC